MTFYGYLICRQQIPSHSYIHSLVHVTIPSFLLHSLPPFLSTSPSPCLPSFPTSFSLPSSPYFPFSFLSLYFFLPSLISSLHSSLSYSVFLCSSLPPLPHLNPSILPSSSFTPFFPLSSFFPPSSLFLHLFFHPSTPDSFHFCLSTSSIGFFFPLWITLPNTELQDGEGCLRERVEATESTSVGSSETL